MSEDIRKMIDKVKNFKQFVNENNNTDGYDMTTTYYIIKLGDSTDDLYLINDTNDFDLVNKYRKNVVFSTNDEMEASLELKNLKGE